MKNTFPIFLWQALLILLLAPLVSGVIKKLKARLQMRRGASVWQPFYDLTKLFRKGMAISEHASWIFRVTPYVMFLTTLVVGLLVPTISADVPLSLVGGVLAVIYLLALGRFFLALAGLDTGSAFGGMGSSREMTISALAEPAMMLSIFTVAIVAGSTNLGEMARVAASQPWRALNPSQILACTAMFLVLLAETGRIPVDNPATHLELTMIHEAMILEYSGPYLALIEWAASMKQLVLMTLLINVFFPFGLSVDGAPASLAVALGLYLAKLLGLAVAVVLVETTNAKLRLFRVPDLLSTGFMLALLALVFKFLF
jgi:formate hydrogenlyase subunit 4